MLFKTIAKKCINFLDALKIILKESCITLFRGRAYTIKYNESLMLITAHSLEKGMGLINSRKGFGKENAIKLCDYIEFYLNRNGDHERFCLLESIGILISYVNYQQKDEVNVDTIAKRLDKILDSLSQDEKDLLKKYSCGFHNIEYNNFQERKFRDVLLSRHSARHFSKKVIERSVVEEAVNLANNAPTACNRQPIRIYCALGKDNASRVNNYLSGNRSFTDDVENFVVLTSERSYFSGREQYQWYINGGIYLAYLSIALHSLGIGNCIMQWVAFNKGEKDLKALLGIAKTESIIAVMAIGYYPDKLKCIQAQRMSASENLIFFEHK